MGIDVQFAHTGIIIQITAQDIKYGVKHMTEKRFVKGYHTIRDIKENHTYDFQVNIICDLLNELDGKWIDEFSLRETLQLELQRVEEENDQLKQQLNDITLNWTQNNIEFDKDVLYVKDNNTEIILKGQNLFISVFIQKIKEYFKFNYIVTGRKLMREYNTINGDDE